MEMIGVGTHIVECVRIARLIERHGEQFLHRVYSLKEIQYCQTCSASLQQFAAHWAAKEAVLKSLGMRRFRGLQWRDIEIQPISAGQFRVRCHGGMKEMVADLGVDKILVSLAHSRNYATAVAVSLRETS